MAQRVNLNVNAQGYRPNNPMPNINFNPQPNANPIDAILSGVERGQSLGLRQKAMQMQEQEEMRRQEEHEQKKFDKSMTYLLDKKFSKYLSPETKTELMRNNIVPKLNKVYGFEIDPSSIEHDGQDDGEFENLLNLVKEKADPSLIKAEYMRLVSKSSEEDLPVLKEIGSKIENRRGGFRRPISKVTDKGEPLYWDSDAEGYFTMSADGTPQLYTGLQYPPIGNPSSGAETKLADIIAQRSLVNESLNKLSGENVGRLDRAYKTIGSYFDSADPEAVYFKSISEMANTIIRNQYYGATLTDNEKKAFMDVAINRDLSIPAFKARVEALRYSFDKFEEGIRGAAAAANRPFREAPSGGPASSDKPKKDSLGLFE